MLIARGFVMYLFAMLDNKAFVRVIFEHSLFSASAFPYTHVSLKYQPQAEMHILYLINL